MRWMGLMFLSLTAAAWTRAAVPARYLLIDIPKERATLSMAEVEVFSDGANIAPEGTASQCLTAYGAEAKRAIDGNSTPIWEQDSMTHTPEDIPYPMWELDFGKTVPVDIITVWNRDILHERFDDARVSLLDEERKVVWSETVAKGDRRHDFTPREGAGETVGTRAPTMAEWAVMVDRMRKVRFVNPAALRKALADYARDYPAVYTDAEALDAEIAEAQKQFDAGDIDDALLTHYRELQKRVMLRHPVVSPIRELIFVTRDPDSKQGFPANWQSHTGSYGDNGQTLRGYRNAILRGPLCGDDGEARVLKSSTAYLGELCLNWDGRRILVSSGEESGGPWGLYELDADTGAWSQVYRDPSDEVDYYDACYLPDGRIISTATVGFQGVPCVAGCDWVANLVLIDQDRKNVRRLTYEQDSDWNPQVYPNGRIVYLRWEYTDSAHYFSRVLMTMNPDGTDQQEFYGSNSYWPNSIFYHQNIPGSSTKFVGIVTGHHGVARKGELVMFDVARGRHETEGAVHKFPFSGKPIENITKDQLVDSVSPFFLHPLPLSENMVLASMQVDGSAPWEIVLVDTYDNVLSLWRSSDANYYEAIPLRATEPPPARADTVNTRKDTCTVYLADVYRGQGTMTGIPKGTVRGLRIFQYNYSPRNVGGHYFVGMEGPWDLRILHGTVEVEPDGSCMFEFPANTPFTVQPIDENGAALQLMRSWLVGMPGETISCIGCHENQNIAPPVGTPTSASRKPPQKVRPWYGEKRGWAFDREIQPVLDRRCVGCHNGDTEKTNAMGQKIPDFSYREGLYGFSASYLALHPYVRRNGPEGDYHVLTPLEFHASTSDLIQLLAKGHHGVTLTREEWDRLTTWIDLNVPYFGTWTERGVPSYYLEMREKYEKLLGNVFYNAEAIVNPYEPGKVAFEAPTEPAGPAEPCTAPMGWPFNGAERQGERQTVTLDLGGGEILTAVRIPAGAFVMGSAIETPAEAPVHVVTVEKPFYMGTTEVTMGMMRQFDPTFENGVYDMHYKDQVRRGYFMNDPALPAIRVSHEQAEAFCRWLSEKTGRKVRLPTETEWEYACRAGRDTPMNYGGINDDFSKKANLADLSLKKMAVVGIDPRPIRNPDAFWDYEPKDARYDDGVLHLAKPGSYEPNAFGLYDMHGNVAEWTSSPFVAYPGGNTALPAFDPDSCVVRGGSWYQRPMRATSASRWGYPRWMRPYNVGFRVVIEE